MERRQSFGPGDFIRGRKMTENDYSALSDERLLELLTNRRQTAWLCHQPQRTPPLAERRKGDQT